MYFHIKMPQRLVSPYLLSVNLKGSDTLLQLMQLVTVKINESMDDLMKKGMKMKLNDQRINLLTQLQSPLDSLSANLFYSQSRRANQIIFIFKQLPKGGGPPPIKFNNMKEESLGIFSRDAPDWRIIKQGLNLQGVCKQKTCKAYNKKVWIQKGFGKFNLNKQVYSSVCPICHKLCEDVQNLALYMAKFHGKGKTKQSQEQTELNFVHQNKENFLSFEDKDQTIVQWLYLEMEVTKLDSKCQIY